jgi:heme/copper-type cytochrome/quinol oxidase subunit 2
MKRILMKAVLIGTMLGFLVLAAAVAAVAAQEPASPAPRVIEMSAANYEFAPSSVHVKVGEEVEINVTATDKEHGIRIKTLAKGQAKGSPPGIEISNPDCIKFKKHETGKISFIARLPGKYEFECCKLCGLDHGKMKGEVVVDP